MNENHQTRFAARVVEALQHVDLDSAMSFFVANSQADENPALQNAMREVIQAEQLRRDGTEISGYPLPAFDDWTPATTLSAGGCLLGIAEVASISGDPGLMDLAFRMLQFWLMGLTKGFVETEATP